MPESMSTGKFDRAQSQARKIAELTEERDRLAKEREDNQTSLLDAHTTQLNKIDKQLDLLIFQTKDLPELSTRITEVETKLTSWKAFVGGIAATCTVIGTTIGVAIGWLVKGR
jgi:hypothetical protein